MSTTHKHLYLLGQFVLKRLLVVDLVAGCSFKCAATSLLSPTIIETCAHKTAVKKVCLFQKILILLEAMPVGKSMANLSVCTPKPLCDTRQQQTPGRCA